MDGQGQVIEVPVSYTRIELGPPDWIVRWCARTPQTDLIALPQPFIGAVRQLERSFFRPHPAMSLIFTYASAADCLNGLLTNADNTPIAHIFVGDKTSSREDSSATTATMTSQLLDWLQITYDELAKMTGISRSTLFYWKKDGVVPRNSHRRQILRLYSLISLIMRRFGRDGGLRWFDADGALAWSYIRGGDLDSAEQVVREKLFSNYASARPGRVIEDNVDYPLPSRGAPLRRATRSSKRGRLGQS